MYLNIPGIHHVTAITSNAQANIDFYCGVLGLRLIKLTVNYDDPGSYHLYYGDETGSPGTILTFFAWSGAPRGRAGPPQVTSVSFAAGAHALDYWSERLREHGVPLDGADERFGEQSLGLRDPDGLRLEIVAAAGDGGRGWPGGAVPEEYAIHGMRGVAISEEGYEKTAQLLTEVMGFVAEGSEGKYTRYRAAGGGAASAIDLLCMPDAHRGIMGPGVVHHVAFRTSNDAQQEVWRRRIVRLGFNVSPVIDRRYFHSIYYREPGGVLFEIATDGPGFTADEPAEAFGTRLMLPPWLEEHRGQIERVLAPVSLPAPRVAAVR